jgi:hypothetical protein
LNSFGRLNEHNCLKSSSLIFKWFNIIWVSFCEILRLNFLLNFEIFLSFFIFL